jgi:hypothetical protein
MNGAEASFALGEAGKPLCSVSLIVSGASGSLDVRYSADGKAWKSAGSTTDYAPDGIKAIALSVGKAGWSLRYRVFAGGKGWGPWTESGQKAEAGGAAIEILEIRLDEAR